ncbi:hypothetical protein L1887_46804 [Cichorium endivia]|nr:hypothetical protein L1887_46804 [Cichorium endivia]
MATATSHNKKSSAVKRILSEARELANDSSDLYSASPLEDNMFEWHFTLRGPANTEFANGLYHGRILLPAEYSHATAQPHAAHAQRPMGAQQEDLPHLYRLSRGDVAASVGHQDGAVGSADVHDGQGRGGGGASARSTIRCRRGRSWPRSRESGQQEAKQEALPDGLCVDLTAQSHKSQPSADTSTSTPAAGPDAAARPIVTTAATSEEPPAPVAAPTPPPPAPIAAAAPAAPTLPAPARLRPSFNAALPPHTSATQHKLSLIDNCIKALSVLVALLVVKRLI